METSDLLPAIPSITESEPLTDSAVILLQSQLKAERAKSSSLVDCGTGFIKMGWSGNQVPTHIVPTAIAALDDGVSEISGRGLKDGISDLDFFTGYEAITNSKSYSINYPIRHGLIESWSNMERIWSRCFFDYMRCDPEDHFVLLTEPPLNSPENREYTAEVMFETFNVPGMYIAVQAILALAASWTRKAAEDRTLTGTVIDSGDGVTHVIPVADGYVIGGAIKHIPLAGRDITAFVQRQLRERGEPVPPEDSLEVAKKIKEEFCYVGQDMVKEFTKYDSDPGKYLRKAMFRNSRTRAPYSVEVGYEQFLAAEMFFNPEIYSSDFTKPLSQVVDESILQCPIDTRRGLYKNIVLSGGSTTFRNFHKRLQQDLGDRVSARVEANMAKLKVRPTAKPTDIKVKVVSHEMQRYAVWFGGSMLASTPEFNRVCITKAQYNEEGPRCARNSAVIRSTL